VHEAAGARVGVDRRDGHAVSTASVQRSSPGPAQVAYIAPGLYHDMRTLPRVRLSGLTRVRPFLDCVGIT
jgi:hypothetical protein